MVQYNKKIGEPPHNGGSPKRRVKTVDILSKFIQTTDFYKQVKKQIETTDRIELNDTFEALNVVLIEMLQTLSKRPIVVVHHNLYHAQKLYDLLNHKSQEVLFFPQDEFITTEMLAMSEDLKMERLHTIEQLINKTPNILVTHPTGFVKQMLPKKRYEKAQKKYRVGEDIDITKLKHALVQYGYKNVSTVEGMGEFAQRGSIFDVFLTGQNQPIRIDLFDTEIDSIRYFDIQTQRSKEKIEAFTMFPRSEFFFDDAQYQKLETRVKAKAENESFSEETIKRVNDELEALKNHESLDQLARYMTFSEDQLETISDYFNEPVVVFVRENKVNEAYETIVDDLREWTMELDEYPKLNFNFIKDINRIFRHKTVTLNGLEMTRSRKDTIKVRAKETPFYDNNFHQLFKDLQKYDGFTTVLITSKSKERLKNITEQLEDKVDVKWVRHQDALFNKRINVLESDNPLSFEWFDTNLIVLNDRAIFRTTEKPKTKYRSVFKEGQKVSHVKQLEKGDYIVHYDHGIGRFLEIKTMELSGRTNDYIVIQYKGEDTLYIPIENIHLIQKYTAHEGVHPKLNKLGSAEWAKTKSRVRKKAKDIADDLIKLYAEREKITGFAFSEDSNLSDTFEADFHFEETEDQLRAIEDVKKDMEAARPMDRLICGDVGYGKTEVALRAAFKATLDNKQVAYLAPTTVLSRQHYITFKNRLEKHGVECALLNRFVTPAMQKRTLKRLKEGKVDIVLGTHRLLSKDIEYKDLGLLIIDEEQRFGVEHKEKIKQLKKHIDVISLSATPIPRTLQMAMTGVKQMSLLETPPKNRLPIQTYVLKRSDHVIKDAVERELARHGQVFYLYNRVDTIQNIQTKLAQLIPDARIEYAHGKMSRVKLEMVMEDFLDHKFDVLVSTTIIETGIDIPNANTLLIHDADKLGLSQLYQIRGRVGRSDRIAYSYLMYQKNKQLSEEAVKRLQVIKEFTELGSGYKIAMRDLAIRGAGDILGTEQSGFIDSVGIDLFLEMLREEIDKNKSIKAQDPIETEKHKQKYKIEIDKTIDKAYISEDSLRLEMHKRIRSLTSSNDYILLKEELTDRFGKVPNALNIYMLEKLYENLAYEKGIERVFDKDQSFQAVFSESHSQNINGERLFAQVNALSQFIHLSYKRNKLSITIEKHKLNRHFLAYLVEILESI